MMFHQWPGALQLFDGKLNNAVALWWLILNTCCFPLTTQQFGFNHFDFGFPGSFPNRNFGSMPSRLDADKWLPPGQELVFSSSNGNAGNARHGGNAGIIGNTVTVGYDRTEATAVMDNNAASDVGRVFVNNVPLSPTMVPFIAAATTPTPQFLQCFQRCPTTSEYNPICASNRQLYGNEQKFNCARRCGADIRIVRRGSCEGLLQMQRG